jgi:hypothetical protein
VLPSLRVVVVMACAVLLTGCPGLHVKIERVKAEYRGTAEWNTSKAAFKAIMRDYVHGGRGHVSDAELDADFEAYVTLSKEEVDEFLKTQTCLPSKATSESEFYMVNSTHQRHDGFFATNQPRGHIAGSGTKHAHATFTANMLLQRHAISATSEFPARAKMAKNPFSSWNKLSQALTDEAKIKEVFHFKDLSQQGTVFAATEGLDFTSKVTGELFIAPTLKGGDVFSPALYAVYLLRVDAGAPPTIYVVVSANAEGEPETPYVGLIDPSHAPYQSETGFAFTYLSTSKNLLNYRLALTSEAPLGFEMVITTAYPDHPESPYLTVRSTFVPAVSNQTVAKYRDSRLTRLILMVRKGALMRDLIRIYYPNSKEVQLWNDVGAIHGTRFRNKLEAAGLNLAADLFDRDLWLEKPKVGGNEPLEFKVAPGLVKECPAAP